MLMTSLLCCLFEQDQQSLRRNLAVISADSWKKGIKDSLVSNLTNIALNIKQWGSLETPVSSFLCKFQRPLSNAARMAIISTLSLISRLPVSSCGQLKPPPPWKNRMMIFLWGRMVYSIEVEWHGNTEFKLSGCYTSTTRQVEGERTPDRADRLTAATEVSSCQCRLTHYKCEVENGYFQIIGKGWQLV